MIDKFIPFIGLFFMGSLFSLIGFIGILRKRKFRKNGVLINSFISNISSYESISSDDVSMNYVYVTYVFNGQQYVRNVVYNKRGMKVGDLVELYCDPYNPKRVTTKRIAVEFIAFSIIGSIIIFWSIIALLITLLFI